MAIVAVDVDDVCADLMTAWLGDYNLAYGDNLAPEMITEWNIAKFTKPQCGSRVYDLLSREMYSRVQPIRGALAGVRRIREMGHRVVFVTSTSPRTAGAKLEWLQNHGFLPRHRYINPDYIEANDKSLVRCDVMVDDYEENLVATSAYPILFSRPHNRHVNTSWTMTRALGWDSVVHLIHLASLSTWTVTLVDDEEMWE